MINFGLISINTHTLTRKIDVSNTIFLFLDKWVEKIEDLNLGFVKKIYWCVLIKFDIYEIAYKLAQ